MPFKLTPYYPRWLINARILLPCEPSPKHYKWNGGIDPRDCYTVDGVHLSALGYCVPSGWRWSLFLRCKMELPNDPIKITGKYKFNQRKVIELSRFKKNMPALLCGFESTIYFSDKFITVVAALYRGDKFADVFAPLACKYAENFAHDIPSNFT